MNARLPLLPPPPGSVAPRSAAGQRLLALATHPRATWHTPTPAPAPPPPSSAPARTTSAAAVAARLVETRWLVVLGPTGRHELHHAIAERPQLAALLETNVIDSGITLTCGTTAGAAAIPGELDVIHTARCTPCGDAVGYPIGTGSPQRDPRCADVLADRLEALR